MSGKMIYEYSTHSINLQERYQNATFSLTIGTLEIVIDYMTRKVLHVQGFLPLVNAVASIIMLPDVQCGDYYVNGTNFLNIEKFDIFSLVNKIPESRKYFEKKPIVFDKNNGIIQLGDNNTNDSSYIKVSRNLIIGKDNKAVIQCIYIIPDKFV